MSNFKETVSPVTRYDFIFSNKISNRLSRHLVFWLLFSLHFMSQNLLIGGYKEALHYRSLPEAFTYIMFFLPFYVASAYFFIYAVLPRFLFQGRLAPFLLSLAGLLAFNFIACNLSGLLYIHLIGHIPFAQISFDMNKYQALVDGIWLPVIVLGITGGAWATKRWFLQQRENEILVKQKITSELAVLKKQIHPRFLFHSLNSLQQDLQRGSSDSPDLILKLSDLLSYILYESDNDTVPLEKEMTMICDYINIEKDNYQTKLCAKIDIDLGEPIYCIAPLLLLPFVENGLEYLSEMHPQEQSLSLTAFSEKNRLHFKLVCSGPVLRQPAKSPAQPIPINVQKRLQNLYPHEHQLEIIKDAEKLSVDLQLTLNRLVSLDEKIIVPLNKLYEPA